MGVTEARANRADTSKKTTAGSREGHKANPRLCNPPHKGADLTGLCGDSAHHN